jgi:GxxExxY protein
MVETRSTFDDPQTYAIVGAGMAVHRELGCGFLEHVYQEAFTIELRQRSIPFVREAAISVKYRGHVLPVFVQT